MSSAIETPALLKVTFERGDDFVYDVVVKDSEENRIDFSAHSGEELIVFADNRHSAELKTYSTSDGTLTTGSDGRVTATFAAVDTADWGRGLWHEFRSVNGSGEKRTWVEGPIHAQR